MFTGLDEEVVSAYVVQRLHQMVRDAELNRIRCSF